ncbi:MAG: tRNA guanosine(34) transglycosylase Tgt [Planctomycetota bacterium]
MSALTYELRKADADPTSRARLGRVTTPHGSFETPAFMPVGTQGTVKGLLPSQLESLGAQIVLGNTYHLMLRPGSERVAEMGGLQKWTGWGRPMLTDSGGFQVFSLGNLNRIDDDGVRFKSHIDGREIELTPQRSMRVQHELGADIIMAFDDCPPAAAPNVHQAQRAASFDSASPKGTARRPAEAFDAPAYERRVREANERTLRWLGRCNAYHQSTGRDQVQALFGIVQGGTDLEQRDACLDAVCSHGLPGYAIGGVAVGEPPEQIRRVVRHTADRLPADRPRYLMGVGYPADLVAAVRAGVDMFDCVLPSRNGRNGHAFLPDGVVRLRNAKHARDPRPIEPGCDCPACESAEDGSARFSRSYLRHLFTADEMLGPILVSLHNQRLYQRLMLDIRAAIRDDAWLAFTKRWPVAASEVTLETAPDVSPKPAPEARPEPSPIAPPSRHV